MNITTLEPTYNEKELELLDNVNIRDILGLCFNVLGVEGRNTVFTTHAANGTIETRLTLGELITAAKVNLE